MLYSIEVPKPAYLPNQGSYTMNLNTSTRNDVIIIEMEGELNSLTSHETYQEAVRFIEPGKPVLLNMTQVSYMSSAGVRTLLLLYRHVVDNGGRVVLVGLSEEIEDTLSITGFLEFFNTSKTVDAGIAALQ